MRPRINKDLVWTTSESETKISYCKKNRPKVTKFAMGVFGRRKFISLDDYKRLKKAGYNVEIVEE